MPLYRIVNNTHRTKAFKVHGGTEDVLPGKERTINLSVELTDEFVASQARTGVKIEAVADAPSERDELKAKADVLGLDYPKNIPTDKLKELVEQAG